MKRGTVWPVTVSLLLCAGSLSAHAGSAADIRGTLKRVPAAARIGQETRVYRGSPPATSSPPGGHSVAYAVEWRDGKAIGQVYVEQPPTVPAGAIETLALNLARAQWQHFRA